MLTCDVTELRDLTFSRSRAPDDRSNAVSLSGGLSDTDDDETFRRDSPWSPETRGSVEISTEVLYLVGSELNNRYHFRDNDPLP